MRLRSGKIFSTSHNTSQTQSSSTSNLVRVEEHTTQPMSSDGNVSTPIGVTTPAVSQTIILTADPEMVTPQPQVTIPSTTPSFSQPISLGPRPTAAQQVTFPRVTREYPWGMAAYLMYGVHTSPSTYADN